MRRRPACTADHEHPSGIIAHSSVRPAGGPSARLELCPVDPGRRVLDNGGADGTGVEVDRADSPDDAVRVALSCTKPTQQDADATNYQTVVDTRRRQLWIKIPSPDHFADWTHFDLPEFWS